jgi:anti-sigma factor (TIGR02949 family)
MTCEEMLRQLADYADGALPESLCDELRRHMAGCEPCQGLQDDLAALERLCRCCAPVRLPDDVRRRVAARLGGRPA